MIILKQLEKKNKSIQIFQFVLKDDFPLFIFFTKPAVVNIKRRQNNDVACNFKRAQKFMRKNDSTLQAFMIKLSDFFVTD